MEVIAIIPARGGSKGIKRKNLVDFQGKPLVAHSIIHALDAKSVDRVLVSTDNEEIAEVSRRFGAEVPFMRPDELAEDHVLDWPVYKHALDWLKENENYSCDYVVHLRPTAPYRKANWIDEAVNLLHENPEAHSVRSVSEPNMHPYRTFEIDEHGYLDPIMKHKHPEPFLLRRQDLPPMYFYNCVIDVTKPSTIYGLESMTGSKLLPYIMDPDDVIDIDSARDLEIARSLFK